MIAIKGSDQPWAIELLLEDSGSISNRTQSGSQLVTKREQELSREPRTEARLPFPDHGPHRQGANQKVGN